MSLAWWDKHDLTREIRLLRYSVERVYRLTGKADLEPHDIEHLEFAKGRIDQLLEETKRNDAA